MEAKKEGAGCVPAPKTNTTSPRSYVGCPHTATCIEVLPPFFPHHAKEVCLSCGAFVRWLPQPLNVEARKQRALAIAKLERCNRLSGWERGFIRSVAPLRKHSPRQIAIIDRMTGDHLEAEKA